MTKNFIIWLLGIVVPVTCLSVILVVYKTLGISTQWFLVVALAGYGTMTHFSGDNN